jgi:hypothetical protein
MVPSSILIFEPADVTINLLGLLGQNCHGMENRVRTSVLNTEKQVMKLSVEIKAFLLVKIFTSKAVILLSEDFFSPVSAICVSNRNSLSDSTRCSCS